MKWCLELVRDFDGLYCANLTIDGNLVKGLPEYVDYAALRKAITERTEIIGLLPQNPPPSRYWMKLGRKHYAYFDATRQREDRRVTPEEIRNGWKPDFSR